MPLAVANRDGGRTSERGFIDGLASLVAGDVISGFRVRANSPLGMSVRIGGEYSSSSDTNRDSMIIRDGNRAYAVFIDDGQAVTVSVDTAHATLPRTDAVVVYIDKAQARVQNIADNTNGVVKAMAVAGVPGSSAPAPTSAAIQSAVGAGNPYVIIGQISIAAGVSTIQQSNITDTRKPAGVSGENIADGSVTDDKWRNGVAFYAYQSAAWNITAKTSREMRHATVVSNIGGAYDSTTGNFTAPVNGMYSFQAGIKFGATHLTRGVIYFYHNGDRVSYIDIEAAQLRASTSAITLYLGAGDTLNVTGWSDTTVNVGGDASTFFSGFLVTRT